MTPPGRLGGLSLCGCCRGSPPHFLKRESAHETETESGSTAIVQHQRQVVRACLPAATTTAAPGRRRESRSPEARIDDAGGRKAGVADAGGREARIVFSGKLQGSIVPTARPQGWRVEESRIEGDRRLEKGRGGNP